jgi:hypothetical protein
MHFMGFAPQHACDENYTLLKEDVSSHGGFVSPTCMQPKANAQRIAKVKEHRDKIHKNSTNGKRAASDSGTNCHDQQEEAQTGGGTAA